MSDDRDLSDKTVKLLKIALTSNNAADEIDSLISSMGSGVTGPTGVMGPTGPAGSGTGPTGPTGSSGVVTATSPLEYDSLNKSLSLNLAALATALSVVPETLRFVAVNGSDSEGDGSMEKPFLTPQKAIDDLASVSGHVAVMIMPGGYSGVTTINRSKIHLIGMGPSGANINSVSMGPIVFDPTGVASGNVNNENSSISNILSNATSSDHALKYTGSSHVSLYLIDSYFYSNHSGKSCIYVDNNPGGSNVSRLYMTRSIANSTLNTGTGPSLFMSSGDLFQSTDCQFYSSSTTGRAILLQGTSRITTFDRANIGGFGSYVVELSSSSNVASMSNCLIQQYTANASGISLASGSQFTSIQNAFNIPNGTGKCVDGSLGAVYAHAFSVYIANNKLPSALGPGVVALTTTHTLA